MIKEKNSVNESNVSRFIYDSDLNKSMIKEKTR